MRTFREIFWFELRQQLKSPLFWMIVLVLAGSALFAAGNEHIRLGGGIGNIHRNAPTVVVGMLSGFNLYGLFLIPMFVAGAALRDFDAGTAELLFATPTPRWAYLGGRFAAGYVASAGMMVVIAIGMLVGVLMPWTDPARLGPTSWSAFAFAFGAIVLPSLFFLSAFLFLVATLTRSMLTTYIGVIAFFVLYAISITATGNIEHLSLAALIDPSGKGAFDLATRYWSANDRNTRLPEFGGRLLANRMIWVAAGAAMLGLAYKLFRADSEGFRLWKRRSKLAGATAIPVATTIVLPTVTLRMNASARWTQFIKLAWFDTRGVLGSAAFLVMLALGLLDLGVLLAFGGESFGSKSYPLTHLMNETIDSSYSFLLMIIMIFHAGELVWRERSTRVSEVTDAFPLPDWIPLLSKFVALASVCVVFLLAGSIACVIYQLGNGYTHIELWLYLANIAVTAVPYLLIGALMLFLQVMSNNKFLGYLFAAVYIACSLALSALDSDHLYNYDSGPEPLYSDMNGYGHFLAGSAWFAAYWASLAAALLVIAALFWMRGPSMGWKQRVRVARQRFRAPARALLAASALAFGGLGSWIFYNTHVLNHYLPDDAALRQAADYEKQYRKYLGLPQPKITAVTVNVDIYPHERKVDIHGHYMLVNKTGKPITQIHVRAPIAYRIVSLKFAPHDVISDDHVNGYAIYRLKEPMAPGATMDFEFVQQYWSRGFRETPDDTQVVDNGTFISNYAFPHFGYEESRELTDRNDRRKYGLGEPHRMPKIDDVNARQFNLMSHSGDWVNFETTVSTVPDQIALAPGYLEKEWTANGRRYFHYRMDKPILDFFSFQSARYAVKKASWHGISLEVYYDPKHAWNTDRMLDAMKKSLAHYTAVYSPYQYRQLRVLEFPGYRGYAESFANTVPFSESAGFTADLRNPDDIDYVSYITAHEIAHQWWGHQVIGADVQGATMLDETFAEYSALMLQEHEYGAAKMRRFLKYESDSYLSGRSGEVDEELPLALNENQPYIHYSKGSLVMYALKDYLGEDVVDGTLARFDREWAFKGPPYPTTKDFLADLREEAGPKWSSLITDLFDRITLYDNRVTRAVASKRADGRYDVTLQLHASKVHVDGVGKQTPAMINIPVDIGVFAQAANGKERDEKVLYLRKTRVANGDSSVTVVVDAPPYEVGIDPYNKLIDGMSDDNRKQVEIR